MTKDDEDSLSSLTPRRLVVSPEEYDRIVEELERPPRVIPGLQELLRRRAEHSPFDE
jgi:uncharacterized protein (DUF1778 family)